ncbi:hypothetical protein [Bacillus coagulans]
MNQLEEADREWYQLILAKRIGFSIEEVRLFINRSFFLS